MLQTLEKPGNKLPPAVAPALWPGVEDWQNTPLQRDFALARQQLPNLKIFTVSADQLGHWPLPPSGSYEHMAALSAREDTLDTQLWSAHLVHLGQLRYDRSIVTNRLGALISDARITGIYREYPVPDALRLTFNHHTRVLAPARHLVVLLPSSEWGVNRFTAEFLKLPEGICCQDDPQISPHRVILAHELGHGQLRSRTNVTYSSWADEFEADCNIRKHCMALGDPASAAYALHLRTLSSFLTPFSPDHIKYWNTLARQEHSGETNPLENIAAVLELKQHALGGGCIDVPPHTPEQIISHAWESSPDLRRAGETLDSRLQLLAGLRHATTKAPLKLKATQALAPHLLAAARFLTPQAVLAPQCFMQ